MQFVNTAHERQIGATNRSRQVVHGAPTDAQQLNLARDEELVLAVESIPLRSAMPPWRARAKKIVLKRELPGPGM